MGREKHEKGEENYFLGRKKSNPDFIGGASHTVTFSGRVVI